MRRLLILTALAAALVLPSAGATASATTAPATHPAAPHALGLLVNDLYVLTDTGVLSLRSGLLPNLVLRQAQVHGLRRGDALIGLDLRPTTGVLYALGRSGQLYVVDSFTGQATARGTRVMLSSKVVGFDFNPVADLIRVTTSRGQNIRLHPDTGALVSTDTPLAYAPGDPAAGTTPRVAASAYSNSVPEAQSTTLYGLDAAHDTLVRQGSAAGATPVISPNTGQLFTIGHLGRDVLAANAFDIDRAAPFNGVAAVRGPAGGGSTLVNIDLRSGRATPLLALPLGQNIVGLTFAFVAPEE